MKKKLMMIVLLVLSAILLVAASVLGTIAFLASSSAVSNTFTYGEVGIEMRESKTDEDGKDLDADQRTVDGNSYKLVPNKSYVKDPAIYVKAGSVPSYLFVKIKNGIATIEKGADKNDQPGAVEGAAEGEETPKTMKQQMIEKGWQLIKENDAGEELYLYVGFDTTTGKTKATDEIVTGELAYKAVGSADKEEVYEIFNTFTISPDAAVADYAGAKVTLTAFAIQTEGFTEAEDGLQGYQLAWNAIVGRFPYESGTQYASLEEEVGGEENN